MDRFKEPKCWHCQDTGCAECTELKETRSKRPHTKQPGSGTEQGYNGWKNYETWNVSLWIGNDESLCDSARACKRALHPYKTFVSDLKDMAYESAKTSIYYQTPDGVAWDDPKLDIDALNAMVEDL